MNRTDRRIRDHHRPVERPSRALSLRVLALLGVGLVVALLVSGVDTKPDRVVTAPGPVKIGKLGARDLQKTSELNGFEGGSKAGQAALAASGKARPAPQGGTVFIVAPTLDIAPGDPNTTVTTADPQHPQAAIRIVGVRSDKPYANRGDAVQDARRVARQRLAEVLQSLDPPVQVLPSDAQIASDFVVANSAKDLPASQEHKDLWKASGLDPNLQWATVDVEVSETQLRTLRAKQRLIDLGGILCGVFAALGLGYGVLKVDALAKNFFTKRPAPAQV